MGELTKGTVDVLSVVAYGDLASLSKQEKIGYYVRVCQRLGLDPLAQPFQILRLQGKEILYCTRAGVQQLTKLHGISHQILAREFLGSDIYVVTARASVPDGRCTESIGAVAIRPNAPAEERANAVMKAETKAKRRATLDLVGLGWLSEDEIDSIPNAQTEGIPTPGPDGGPGPGPTAQQKRKLWAVLREHGLGKEEAKLFYDEYAKGLSAEGFSGLIEEAPSLIPAFVEHLRVEQLRKEAAHESNESA